MRQSAWRGASQRRVKRSGAAYPATAPSSERDASSTSVGPGTRLSSFLWRSRSSRIPSSASISPARPWPALGAANSRAFPSSPWSQPCTAGPSARSPELERANALAEQEYVALDLELIEPNSPRSRVIEIAAVRFTERAVLEEWSTLVNPSASLPYTIRQLTGIDDRELTAAPSLDSIAERLRAFVGRTSIVGQSVEIDVAHLARQGIALDAPILDTFELASLLLPGLPSY